MSPEFLETNTIFQPREIASSAKVKHRTKCPVPITSEASHRKRIVLFESAMKKDHSDLEGNSQIYLHAPKQNYDGKVIHSNFERIILTFFQQKPSYVILRKKIISMITKSIIQ